MESLPLFKSIVGENHVLTGQDTLRYSVDFTNKYKGDALCVVRPNTTEQVSEIVKIAAKTKTPLIPIGGNTGLTGATYSEGAVLLSLERLNRVRKINTEARLAEVEAGVILANLHDAVAEHGLSFPLTFGARGSATIGGNLATNAGGSNVVRYGNTRALCLGLEVVLPSGEIMDLLTELHKDNSGYDLKDLFIGAEGTLGIITAATLKLTPTPAAFATAMVALSDLSIALELLNKIQKETGGAVEAFEYMPARYMDLHAELFPQARPPFETTYPVNIMLEVGATAPRDTKPDEAGEIPIVAMVETILGEMIENGAILDATVAQNEAQRREMWERREQAAELAFHKQPFVNHDISVPLDKVAAFLERIEARMAALDPAFDALPVAHLGDGNVHYTVWPSKSAHVSHDAITEAVEDVVQELGGAFSAEHGIGASKLASMSRRKNPVALATMRAIKQALDPQNIMNPGKLLP
ncbi:MULTISPECIES: FAD-binding oxidoreductase [Halocynthiibacter]|uniref:FAD-binding oxidoreductase n=1 Tax=Halocynthiibacter halioticoli TaxID=2986804 RepID=A0AAE3IYN5_9RHOB|nr:MULTISPECIES: FAD-binding oxidoreductase [Halocynthiibacter]MCV6823356.1 FAD-binding oxidoreductase [Halocynthiibacter halioticoli]MCW4056357.1 FAD-binding oxidoreductase [Halocynthiibacter sp. SDUM655004]